MLTMHQHAPGERSRPPKEAGIRVLFHRVCSLFQPILQTVICASLVFGAATAGAQDEKAIERQVTAVTDPKAFRIEFKESPSLEHGKVALIEGVAGPEGVRFVAEYLSILQPIVVTALAKSPDDDVRVALSKYRYDEADRSGTTKGKGIYTTRLRTEGDLKIVVSAPEPTPFQLVVWAGDPVELPMKPVLVSNPARVRGESAGLALGGSVVTWVIAVSLVVIAGLLGVIVLRGKRS